MGKWTYGELATDRVAVSRPRSLSDAVLDTAPDAVVTFDARGHIVALSSAAERRLGFEHAEVLCRSIAHHAIAGAPAGSRGVVGGERLELPARWADGREVLVELSFVRTCRSPVRFTAWLRELGEPRTLRVQAERNAALLAGVEELTHVGRWEWMPQDDELVCSAELCRILDLPSRGRTPCATALFERAHPDDRAPLRRALVLLRATGTLQPLAYRVVLPDGALRHVRATLAVAAWRDGQAHRIVGWVQDVTEQHLAEREIAAHCAVTEALAGWTSLDTGAGQLLASLGEAMGADAGVFWVPLGEVLVAPVVWTAPSSALAGFAAASGHAHLAPGAGAVGRAWQLGEPVVSAGAGASGARREAAQRDGVRATIAVPALDGAEVLAVVELACRELVTATSRLERSLARIGHELGHFLARRRGQLVPTRLTPRELEVLQLAARGMSAPRAAKRLGVSPATVRTHLENIYPKLGVRHKAAAVAEALRQGLLE